MRVIDRIEINYFRSIYSITLSNLTDLNTFVGGNDAGKSNILKSLNLFFNNEPEVDSGFDFLRDLSRFRESEARKAKGRATIWIRVTFNNFLGWKSLPSKFSVKRSWNRYTDTPADTYPNGVEPTIIPRFLNKLAFHYVPAVRSRDIFSHYLAYLHDSLIDDEQAGVRNSASELLETINSNTQDMSHRISESLGINSRVKVPENLRDLFRALDFSTEYGEFNVPLQFRGDGIQARHIPFILDFIARHDKKYHIWAYEEPENSLEMSKAFELAQQFQNDFSEENQIFLTTHSPAFYDLGGKRSSKWLVENSGTSNHAEFRTVAEPVGTSEHADQRLGVGALISDRAREVFNERNRLQKAVDELSDRLQDAKRPQILVEGPSDSIIFQAAAEKLYPTEAPFCDFVSAEGVDNITSFIKTSARIENPGRQVTAGLVDNDRTGRGEARKFQSLKFFDGTSFRVVDKNKGVFHGILPVPDMFADLRKTIKKICGDDFDIPLCVEFMFDPATIAQARQKGVLELKPIVTQARGHELGLEIDVSANLAPQLPDGMDHFAYQVRGSCKTTFAQWTRELDAESFRNFVKPLEQIRQICGFE